MTMASLRDVFDARAWRGTIRISMQSVTNLSYEKVAFTHTHIRYSFPLRHERFMRRPGDGGAPPARRGVMQHQVILPVS